MGRRKSRQRCPVERHPLWKVDPSARPDPQSMPTVRWSSQVGAHTGGHDAEGSPVPDVEPFYWPKPSALPSRSHHDQGEHHPDPPGTASPPRTGRRADYGIRETHDRRDPSGLYQFSQRQVLVVCQSGVPIHVMTPARPNEALWRIQGWGGRRGESPRSGLDRP